MTRKQSFTGRVAFFGTSEFAVYVFDELLKARIEPIVLVTQPDKPAGRGLEVKESPAKSWAIEKGIAVMQPSELTRMDKDMGILFNSDWDAFIVASYGKIMPKAVLDLPDGGTLNVHPSLLPMYRGPSPIESQILNDDKTVGVSVMLLDEEMDHGPIVAQASVELDEWPIKYSILEELLGREGGELLAELLPTFIEERYMDSENALQGIAPTLIPTPQEHSKATFTSKVEKADGLINLNDNGYKNFLKYCAFDVWPGTYFMFDRGTKSIRVKITEAAYENSSFVIKRVVPEGKREMDYESFLRGFSDK